jgi:hypothetical protein
VVQRQAVEDEQLVMPSPADSALQRQTTDEEDDQVQAKRDTEGALGSLDTATESRIHSASTRGEPLPHQVRGFFEQGFGRDFSNVRVNTSGEADSAARSIDASAFTLGNTISFASGKYDPESDRGKRLLAHELAHTVQQSHSAPAPQRKIRVGQSRDAHEHEADRAADAVLRNERAPSLTPVHAVAQRAPYAEDFQPDGAKAASNQVKKQDTDGTWYRITRNATDQYETQVSWTQQPWKFKPKYDFDNIWLEISVCRGYNVELKFGADIPAALKSIVEKVVKAVVNGKDVGTAVSSQDVTPFFKFLVEQGGTRFTGGVKVSVTKDGVTKIDSEIAVGKGACQGTLGSSVTLDPSKKKDPDWSITGGFKCDLDPIKTKECPPDKQEKIILKPVITYKYEKWVPAHEVAKIRKVPTLDRKSQYVYFDYMNTTSNEPDQAQRNLKSMEEIRTLLKDGYVIKSIVGHTSPEGLMKKTASFEGNTALAQRRAEAAKKLILALCASDSDLKGTTGLSELVTAVKEIGEDELYTLYDEKIREVEGPKQTAYAEKEFGEAPAEERHRSPELAKDLEKARKSKNPSAAVAKLIYPFLRRAEVSMEKAGTRDEKYTEPVAAKWEDIGEDKCPENVRKAAELQFRVNAMLSK